MAVAGRQYRLSGKDANEVMKVSLLGDWSWSAEYFMLEISDPREKLHFPGEISSRESLREPNRTDLTPPAALSPLIPSDATPTHGKNLKALTSKPATWKACRISCSVTCGGMLERCSVADGG